MTTRVDIDWSSQPLLHALKLILLGACLNSESWLCIRETERERCGPGHVLREKPVGGAGGRQSEDEEHIIGSLLEFVIPWVRGRSTEQHVQAYGRYTTCLANNIMILLCLRFDLCRKTKQPFIWERSPCLFSVLQWTINCFAPPPPPPFPAWSNSAWPSWATCWGV